MNKIISLKKIQDYEKYNPILTLSEDLDFDNLFCILNTNVGNIAFSYYDLVGIEGIPKRAGALFMREYS